MLMGPKYIQYTYIDLLGVIVLLKPISTSGASSTESKALRPKPWCGCPKLSASTAALERDA